MQLKIHCALIYINSSKDNLSEQPLSTKGETKSDENTCKRPWQKEGVLPLLGMEIWKALLY